MKKRLISMLMAVLMIASLLPAAAVFAGAEEAAPDTHEHKYTTVSIKKDAEKKTPGVEYKVCKECGKIDPASISIKIKAFALLWNQCGKCETGKTMIVKAASCRNEGLTISYCEKCGKAFPIKEFADKAYKVDAALDHVYDNFSVEVKPSCTEDGWGYVTCKLCGDPQFVADAGAAVKFVKADNFNSVKDFEARVREVNAMFAAVNPEHKYKTMFVAVTEPMKAADGTMLKPAEKAAHISTVNGKAYVFNATTGEYEIDDNAETFHAGYKGDTVCPYCKGACNEAYVIGGPEDPHTWNVAEKGNGGFPEDNSYGKADIIECKDCNYTGGAYIYSVNSWYDESTAKDPTCTEPGNYATYYWRDSNGEIQHKDGDVRPATGHNFVAAPGKPVNGHEDGYIYVDYEVCTKCGDHRGDESKKVELKAPSATCKYEPEVLVPATCNSYGLSISKCPVCGAYEKTEAGAYVTATIAKEKKHVASDKLANVKEATCTEVGYTGDKVCKFCDIVMEKGKEIPMIDHTPMDVDAKAPTCTEPGVTKGTVCKVCGTVLSAQETVPALGHKTELVNAKEATCLEAGYTGDKVCTVCKQTIEKGTEVKALGHNYVKGVCTRCDAKQPGYNPFTDVKKGPYYDAILWAYCNGVTNGISDTVFGVDNGCTRAQIVTFLYRAAGQPKVENVKNPFTDVSKNSTYYNAIMWAVENGITTGKTATSFDPNAVCTRGQIVTFLWRYEKAPIVSSLAKFDDVAAGSYCYNAVMWAVENGITNGKTTTTFAPNDTCTRAQAVTFIYREFAK